MVTRRIVLSILLLAASFLRLSAEVLPAAKPESVGLSSERLARIDRVMRKNVESKDIAGVVTMVARCGKTAHLKAFGMADIEAGKPMTTDTIFRIASMTKPVTSVAVMMLWEEGKFLLNDPVSKFIPEFKDVKVLPAESEPGGEPTQAKRPITIRHLLTHTSGLSYQWNERIGADYKKAGITHGLVQDLGTIGNGVKTLAGVPLLFSPGEAFHYGLSIDVLGRIVEVASGQSLAEFFEDRIFSPLGMKDTHFFVPRDKHGRIAAVYERRGGAPIARASDAELQGAGSFVYSVTYPYEGPTSYFSGGGGLSSTIGDYARFAQMLLSDGELNGARLLSRKTVELMTGDHLADMGIEGAGFGLGFFVVREGKDLGTPASPGTFGWGGFFNTTFFIDPAEDMFGIFMSQLYPNGNLGLQARFRVLVYQAIAD